MEHRIQYSGEALEHLRDLTAAQQSLIIAAIRDQLTWEPEKSTRNRKRLRPNPIAPWELRVRNLRAFYLIEEGSEPIVSVVAIGIKVGNRVRIGNEEMEL